MQRSVDMARKWQERLRQAMLKRKAELERALASNLKEVREDGIRATEFAERATDDAADDLAAGLAEIESAELAQIEEALREDDPDLVRERRAIATKNTWEERVEMLSVAIEDVMTRGPGARPSGGF